jgi:PAS domain S-box-containing protein
MNEPNMPQTLTQDQIMALQARLTEAEATLRAIRQGEVDAITVPHAEGEQVYSLTSVERVYRDMIETMSEGALNVTQDGMILYCNESFARMTKADPTTVMGSNLLTYFVESDRAAINRLLSSPTPDVKQIRAGLCGADGQVLTVNVASHVSDSDDQPYTVITIISDLTDILAAQASRMAALRYARELIEAILDPLITIDTHGKITDVNHATELVTGRSATELIDTDFTDYFTDPDRARAFYEQVYSQGFMIDVPLNIRSRYGPVTAMLCNASLYREDDGRIGGVVAVGRDITHHYPDRIKAKYRTYWRAIVLWPAFIAALVGFLLLASAMMYRIDAWTKAQLVSPISLLNPPYLHAGDHRPTTAFHAGQVVFLHVSTHRSVPCYGLNVERILSLTDGDMFNRTVWSDFPVSFGYTNAGDYEFDYRFTVPSDLLPGDYALERNVISLCGPTNINQTEPFIPFSVVK